MERIKACELSEGYVGRRVSFKVGDTRIIGAIDHIQKNITGKYTVVGIENIPNFLWLYDSINVLVA